MSNKFVGALGGLSVYVDSHASDSDPAVITKYKAKTGLEVGAFYCPYIPLMVADIARPPIEELAGLGIWKFLLRRRPYSDLPFDFTDQISVDAFEWIRNNVVRADVEITYLRSDDFGGTHYQTRYGYIDTEAAPPHYHMVIEFFSQKDAALFKLMHL